ncbi:MAG: Rpn family recombination-promoting nuclease/putative transposase, partial [Planctomycetaceae bacterium]|nr:Rpn family recombination-promoting nuclease/putative transposase [Planctomycetaceae bacterium]
MSYRGTIDQTNRNYMMKPDYSEITPPDDSENLPESAEIWEVPEDRFCRKMAEDEMIAADILRYYVDSRIAKNIDVSNLKPARTNFFGISKKEDPFREIRIDIPYTSRLLVDDQLGYEVLFVIEHKSGANDFIFLQVYPYMDLSNFDKWKRAGHPTSRKTFRPYITLAVLIYCGEDKPDDVQYYQDMFPGLPDELREFVPQSKLIRANLNNHPYDQLPGRPETRAVVETIKRIQDGTAVEHFGDIIANFKDMTWDDRIKEIVHSICFYTASREPIDPKHIQETIQQTIPGKEGKHMAGTMVKTLYDEIFEKGAFSG